MSLIAIQQILAKIALSLQALFLVVTNAQQLPPQSRTKVMAQAEQSLVQITTTLQTLSTQIAGTPEAKPVTASAQPLAAAPLNIEELNARVRAAVVNILCMTTSSRGPLRPISGSGVVIDPRGVVLTNAHIGEHLLLKDYNTPSYMNCVVRTGNPAETTYRARLLYISNRWVENNLDVIRATKPTGTGENDFALLLLTDREGRPLQDPIPFVSLDGSLKKPPTNAPILLVAYPAELTRGILVQRNLYQVSSHSTVSKGYYFKDNERDALDLLNVGNTILSQGGSSGGAVIDQSTGALIGIIVTTTSGETTSSRELFAITSSHILHRFSAEAEMSLARYLRDDLFTRADEFEALRAAPLRTLLIRALEG